MTSVIYPSRLLKTAKKLAGVDAGPDRPGLTDLRRATSTAYYALFHQIIRHGAIDFAPCADEEVIATVARWYTHTGIHAAAGLVTSADRAVPLEKLKKQDRAAATALRSEAGTSGGRLPRDVVIIADAFQTLQAARHSADYDGNYDPVRAVTINHIEDAETALRTAWSLWESGFPSDSRTPSSFHAYQTFLRLALLQSGGPKTR